MGGREAGEAGKAPEVCLGRSGRLRRRRRFQRLGRQGGRGGLGAREARKVGEAEEVREAEEAGEAWEAGRPRRSRRPRRTGRGHHQDGDPKQGSSFRGALCGGPPFWRPPAQRPSSKEGKATPPRPPSSFPGLLVQGQQNRYLAWMPKAADVGPGARAPFLGRPCHVAPRSLSVPAPTAF